MFGPWSWTVLISSTNVWVALSAAMVLTSRHVVSPQVRLNFLSTLLEEAYGHLHCHLTAGVLGRKLFTMPFTRDVKVTEAAARAMRASLLHCKQVRTRKCSRMAGRERLYGDLAARAVTRNAVNNSLFPQPHTPQEGGVLLVAPEHRLSLKLKRQELWEQGVERAAETAALDRLEALPYLDILDESDELLHHR